MKSTRAVVDVGTNSVKLLVAQVAEGVVQPIWEESHQTRLGEGFYPEHVLQAAPIAETAKTVAAFATKAAALGATRPRIVATSAAREAKNRSELVSAIETASGLSVEIISGDQEATYAFLGVNSDPRLAHKPLMLLDVGGGSTELVVAYQGKKQFAESFELGTVRLLHQLRPDDPPEPSQLAECRKLLKRFLAGQIMPQLMAVTQQTKELSESLTSLQLVGTGGTATILGCMEAQLNSFDRERLETTILTMDRLQWHVEKLWRLPIAERRRIVGLPPNRADVILTGAAIFEAIMQQLHFQHLRVSTRGLRFAVVLEATELQPDG